VRSTYKEAATFDGIATFDWEILGCI